MPGIWQSIVKRASARCAVAALVICAAACGTSSTGDSAAAPISSAAAAAEARAALTKAYAGISGEPPTVTSRPTPGVTMWVVSCGQQSVGCVEPTEAALAAGRAAGWDVHMCDGKLSATGWGSCVRRAIDARADVIITEGVDCPAIQAPLTEAKAAGIVTINAGGFDCDIAGGERLYSAVTQPLTGWTIKEYRAHIGALQADYVIGKTNGRARVLLVNFTDPVWGPIITEGFKTELAAACTGCELVKQLNIGNKEMINNTLGTKFASALLANPTVNAVVFPVEAFLQVGIGAAITSSGRRGQLTVIGNSGNAPNLDIIRDGGTQDGDVGYSAEQLSWAAVDDAIRLLAGAKPAESAGVGLVVVDKDHNLPTMKGRPYTPSFDFVSHYRKGWGVG